MQTAHYYLHAPFSRCEIHGPAPAKAGVRGIAIFFLSLFLLTGGCKKNKDSTSSSSSSGQTEKVKAVKISAGANHTCAITSTGGVKCWGLNSLGQLGDGTTTDRLIPVDVVGLTSGVINIASGVFHTCAVTTSGTVKCWGWNYSGQLGNGTSSGPDTCVIGPFSYACSTTPVDVSGISGASALAAGYVHTYALATSGTARCWGFNGHGQLGNGSTTPSTSPVDVTGLSDVFDLVAGDDHTCALTTFGTVKCWGWNIFGQLGNGNTTSSSTPEDVTGIADVTALSARGHQTCILTKSGQVQCWGRNDCGQLGNGTSSGPETCIDACSTIPVNVTGISGVKAITVGGGHTCAITTSGTVKCWGGNAFAQLGNGTTSGPETCSCQIVGGTACSTAPVNVTGLIGVSAIAVGGGYTCALTSSSGVKCWGGGLLGNGSATGSLTPVDVVGFGG